MLSASRRSRLQRRRLRSRAGAIVALVILASGVASAVALRAAPPAGATPRSGASAGAASALAASAPGGAGQLAPYLRFTGSGTVRVTPDQATLQFTTAGSGSSLATAQNQASARMTTLLAAFQHAGIAKEDLATGSGWAGQDGQHPGRYNATQDLTVTVHDISRAGALLALGTDNGATSSYGPSFSLQDAKSFYAAALRAAIDDARAKAEAAASLIGATVTGVVSVDEQGGGQPPILTMRTPEAGDSKTNPVPVSPGTQEVSASVTVVFAYRTN